MYDLTEVNYQIKIANICSVIEHDCCGFLENNYVLLDNTNLPGGNIINQEQMMWLRGLLIAPSASQAYMLKALHLEPERTVEETALFDFLRVLGGSSFCDFMVHLSLEGAHLQAEGIGKLCDAIQGSKPEHESFGPGRAIVINFHCMLTARYLDNTPFTS